MAMNGNTLGDAIKAACDAAVAANPTANDAQRTAMWRAVGTAIVTHIASSAVVTVAGVTAVQPGAGTSGPGTGTVS
jgi:hypothetical protein